MMDRLNCYRNTCDGRFTNGTQNYECEKCGVVLEHKRIERIAQGQDSLAAVADSIVANND